MKFSKTFLSLAAAAACFLAPHMRAQSTVSPVEKALSFSQKQLKATVLSMPDMLKLPRSTKPDGSWDTVPPEDWTSGFFPGCLWKMYELSKDTFFLGAAQRWTEVLEAQQYNLTTHDLGFMLNDSYGEGNRLVPNEHYKRVLLQTAQTLASRFNPRVGCTLSWSFGKWQFPVIVDNMMNLELLFWAAKNGGDPKLAEMAVSHGLRTMTTHVRADGSTYHLVDFDTLTGNVLKKQTVQGFADESAWARGQAWAVYGFTAAYRESRDVRFLATAERTADFFIKHLPADNVPYWDFRSTAIPNDHRDVSAAAITSSALFELSTLTKDAKRAASYLAAAKAMLFALCAPPYLAEGSRSKALLNHAVGHKPGGTEIDVSIIYADYYFLEAITRFKASQTAR